VLLLRTEPVRNDPKSDGDIEGSSVAAERGAKLGASEASAGRNG